MTYPTMPPAAPTPPQSGKRPDWLRWVLLAVGVVALLGIGAAIGSSTKKTETDAVAATVGTTSMVTVTKAAAPMTVTQAAASVAAPKTVTVTAKAPEPVTVTASAPPAVTVTQTPAGAPAAPAGGGDTGPFMDGTYLIGTEIQPGTYKCAGATSDSRWIIEDKAGETMDIDFSSVARVAADGYTVQFKDCPQQWEKVG